MGQYHYPVSMDAKEYLDPHYLGAGLKEWEQMAGSFPSALAFLLAHNPGNMPADVGHHPMAGRWAGHRILAVGDYAENTDIKRFQGPPLKRLYGLCHEAPTLDTDPVRIYYRQGSARSYSQRSSRYDFDSAKGPIRTIKETPESRLKEAMRYHKRRTANGKYDLFENASRKLRGVIEYVQSVRFCGSGWSEDVPVKPYAERGQDGHLHYRITDAIAENANDWNCTLRMIGLGGWDTSPKLNPRAELMPNGERWPWDRPPADLSWHDATDADQDMGQSRVWINLEKREYVDPAVFGEVPTTIGIMRATSWQNGALASSAACVLGMLYHPAARGGGDIDPETYSAKGRWRNCHLALTAERGNDALIPTTEEAKASFTNISDEITQAAAYAVKRDNDRAA